MDELRTAIQNLAKEYWNESGDSTIDTFPMSIVRFVLEYAIGQCHFPKHFKENDIINVMNKFQNALAMASVDVYAKAGAEGETSHSENGIVRAYSDSYIDKKLLSQLPNYVSVM